ncbi:MAG: protein kinase [Deltaproteobacteria bacterium]|nr:protein kinase [Deltaproteobacteria bacterium]
MTASDLTGRIVGGKFRLRRCVGVGASGAVYEADQIALGRTVAVKVLRDELTQEPGVAERFHEEALLASRLNHPNTVSVIDYGSTPDGLLYMVMEFLRGRTLTRIVQDASEPLPIDAIVEYVTKVLEGLEEAHEAGVVHADLKADNVMVDSRRGSQQVKVVDFGIARLVSASDASSDSTANQTICGTPEYMAPEVISGKDPTFASDLYAVGCLLFELVTGKTPFVGGGVMEVLSRHLRDRHPSAAELRPDTPEYVVEAIDRALSKDPSQRFGSATDFKDFLRRSAPVQDGGELVLCTGCGVRIARTFRFCPECGQSRPKLAGKFIAPPTEIEELPSKRRKTSTDTDDLEAAGRIKRSTEPDLLDEYDDVAAEFAAEGTSPGVPDAQRVGLLPLPMVGRSVESERLFQFLTATSDENFMQVTGETGSGKARLIIREAQRAATVGALVFLAGPDPSGLKSSLYPIRSMLTTVLDLADGGRDSVAAAIEELGLNERDVPALLDLFGHETELGLLEPHVRRRELLASALRVMSHASQRRQAVLVFLDVDGYDRPSQELLRQLAKNTELESTLRVVASNSKAYAKSWPPRVSELFLDVLPESAIEQLEVHLLAHGSEAMPRLETLNELCGRKPEHIYQLTRYVLEGGVVEAAPSGLSDLIAERIELLPYEAQLLVQAAAVFGSEVWIQDLEVAAAEHFEAAELAEALAVLIARGILEQHGDLVRFDQPLERDVVYDSTPADVRRALHDLAFTALQGTESPELILGHHAEMAGHPHIAGALLERAGDSAIYQLDEPGAADLYQRSLNASRSVLMSEPSESNEARYVATSIKLADSLRVNGETRLARGVVAEARRYAQQAPALTAAIDRAEASLLAMEGWLEPAEECLRRGLAVAIQTGQTELMTELYRDLATLMVRASRSDDAIKELEEAIDMLTWGEGPRGRGGPPTVWMLVYRLAKLHAAGERLKKAAEIAEAGHLRAMEHAPRAAVARIRTFLANVYKELGDPKEAQYRNMAIADLREIGDRRGTAELLKESTRPTMDLGRTGPELIREAERLAAEVAEVDEKRPLAKD